MTDLEVVDGGASTTIQDVPGRTGYWHVGVPPNGPMDDLSHRLVNRVLGNLEGAAALELTGDGPVLRANRHVVVAVGGAPVRITVDGRPRAMWTPLHVAAGSLVEVGRIPGPGLRATLGVRGGVGAPRFLGSRSTFTLGRYGGLDGRPLRAGDALDVVGEVAPGARGEPAPLPAGMAPGIGAEWELGVLVGPHAAPDFLTPQGLAELLSARWEVHHNSARTGVRLIGPAPRWARADGGEAGLHPSNVHDTGYAVGAVDLTGDMPVILGPDGPSLGGFVCPAVVAASERWKLGQLRPGDGVRLVAWAPSRAAEADRRRADWLDRATRPVQPLARPSWNEPVAPAAASDRPDLGGSSGVIARGAPPALPLGGGSTNQRADGAPVMTCRRAGDRFLLVEFGEMVLDLGLRLRVHALDRWVRQHLADGLVDATPGVRSLLVQVDGHRMTVDRAAEAIRRSVDELEDVVEQPFDSRVVRLPLSWDDPSTREAIERYMAGVRADAPWCPWNIEFIRRVNGLASTEEVRRIVFDAAYLVLGLGDVYLGAPVATPLDPRHRLVTTKYNPARTWTPENAVGIGGAYLCIYGMEGPGGYQFVGRTVQVWNAFRRGPHFVEPWLLRPFDQLRWYPVTADELPEMREAQAAGALHLDIEPITFSLAEHRAMLAREAASIAAFRARQQAAFGAEREAWAALGELQGAGVP